MMKKSFGLVAALAMVCVFFVGWSGLGKTAAAEREVVKIGLSAPLTGDWAEYGADFKRSVQMVIDRVNRMGGIRGREVELVVEDSRGDPKESVLIANKFVADPKIISEIGDFSSSSCMAAAPIYEAANMTQLSPTSSHEDFTRKGKNMFRVVATQSYEGPHNARWAVKDLGFKKLATIYINNDWGVDANKYFVTEAKKLGADVVAQEGFVPGEKDFTAILTKIKQLDPQLLYIPVFYVDAAAILNQAKRMRFEPVVMGNSSLFTEKLIELGGEAVEGIILPANYFTSDPRPAAQEFLRDYRANYNADPNQFAALAYDAANLTVAALHWMGVEDRSKVREGLTGLRGFQGATGPISYAEGRDPAKEMVRITVVNGKWVLYHPQKPKA
jgi:branched-chain amino acid transport system substrate-binding protein